VLGLLGYATGALAMALAQSLTAIIIFWAIIGGLGASLLLPSMQSLIHGNFVGDAQKKAYPMVGAAAAIAAAVGPLLGGFITRYLSWRIAFLLEDLVIAIVLSGIKLVRDVPYTGPRGVDWVGALLSAVGMGGIVLGILSGRRGVSRWRRCSWSARSQWECSSGGWCDASAAASRRCSTRGCSAPSPSGWASPSRCSSRSRWAAR
jgi:MFS family permease